MFYWISCWILWFPNLGVYIKTVNLIFVFVANCLYSNKKMYAEISLLSFEYRSDCSADIHAHSQIALTSFRISSELNRTEYRIEQQHILQLVRARCSYCLREYIFFFCLHSVWFVWCLLFVFLRLCFSMSYLRQRDRIIGLHAAAHTLIIFVVLLCIRSPDEYLRYSVPMLMSDHHSGWSHSQEWNEIQNDLIFFHCPLQFYCLLVFRIYFFSVQFYWMNFWAANNEMNQNISIKLVLRTVNTCRRIWYSDHIHTQRIKYIIKNIVFRIRPTTTKNTFKYKRLWNCVYIDGYLHLLNRRTVISINTSYLWRKCFSSTQRACAWLYRLLYIICRFIMRQKHKKKKNLM